MDSLQKASDYVISAGEAYHHLAVRLVGVATPRAKDELVAEIKASQNDDGAFAGSTSKGEPGSVPATSRRVELLARAGEAEAAQKGAAWLASMQRAEGGFSENAALADKLKPEWDWYSAANPVTWITGDAMVALAAVGGFDKNINFARNFLLRARNKDGGWPGQVAEGYPDRTDLWTVPGVVQGLLAAGVAANHDVFSGLAGALGRQKDAWRNPIANPLPAFLGLGRRAADADVQGCLKLLAETQNDDGGWPYLAGSESHPDPTTAVIALLRRYRLDLPA